MTVRPSVLSVFTTFSAVLVYCFFFSKFDILYGSDTIFSIFDKVIGSFDKVFILYVLFRIFQQFLQWFQMVLRLFFFTLF